MIELLWIALDCFGLLWIASHAGAVEEASAAKQVASGVWHELAVDKGSTAPKANKAMRMVKDARVFDRLTIVDHLLTQRTLLTDLTKEERKMLVAIRLSFLRLEVVFLDRLFAFRAAKAWEMPKLSQGLAELDVGVDRFFALFATFSPHSSIINHQSSIINHQSSIINQSSTQMNARRHKLVDFWTTRAQSSQ